MLDLMEVGRNVPTLPAHHVEARSSGPGRPLSQQVCGHQDWSSGGAMYSIGDIALYRIVGIISTNISFTSSSSDQSLYGMFISIIPKINILYHHSL